MTLQENIQIIKEMINLLNEDRLKGYKRFLKDNVFINFPDYVINDMVRESGDLDFSQVKNMNKEQIINYFFHGNGKRFFERWGGYQTQKKPKLIEIKWDDLVEPLQQFLKNKMSGEDLNFPHSRERIVDIMKNQPNLGKGENEPILLQYNEEGKIQDIPGGNHRLYAAFELNDFEPIKMNAYVSNL